ncbi:pyridoxal phosphate-dependent transferase [Phascolomyces articulosus]|uniref:Glutamate pyruvate transaminase n=1 Tax=Phascolomyces articulosus TaxID=60185 RepID=A0AAD5K0I3_9FUNG|nr:pyridoxal phosphate-dependent transferase [Phascolomyces articulosus]
MTLNYDNEALPKVLTVENMNPHIREMEYAVRGRLAIRAEELRDALAQGEKLPFKTVVSCNIGNPQQLNQKPITFFRQVVSLCENPDLLAPEKEAIVSQLYPIDAIERARQILKDVGASIGAYSHSQGVPALRKSVADFIAERDGHPADPNSIYLTQGASSGVQNILSILTQNEKSGILIPIPQYPLYSATLTLLGATPVPYYLDEETGWSLDVEEIRQTVREARSKGTDVRALVIINPGNPTGQCLDALNMQDVLTLCHQERLVLLADEVYQTNIYEPEQRPFVSFKKALKEHPQHDTIELVSFHSISKGMIGECGRRGGYFECCNLDKGVMDQLYKMASVSLCPNVSGQIMTSLMVTPPKQGDPSYELYHKEMTGLYESLRRRSKKLEAVFNDLEGVTCQPAMGSMYLFPRIRLPEKALARAAELNQKPDAFYCDLMLEATGVCVVPGSGFAQKDGTWHFRSTFLPPEELFDDFCNGIRKFHQDFMNEYNK